MIRRVLKNKLVALGYAATYIESKIKEFNISIDTSNYTESELNQKIQVLMYDKPTTEVPRFFLNVNGKLVDKFLFDGQANAFTKFSIIGSQISLLDYPLGEKLCAIGITKDADIIILMYMPSKDTAARYGKKTYEDLYAEDRDGLVSDYIEALTAGNRLSSTKAKDILYVLLSEFIIDTILVENSNPRLKLYDNAAKFADNLTNYEYKYINRRINRIEYVEKTINPKFIGFGVELGRLSNDPYILLSDVNKYPEFYLNRPTYLWNINARGQEEIAIYTANETYPQNTYREMMSTRNDSELISEAEKYANKFTSEIGYTIPSDYILSVFKKLNRELIVLPVDFIRGNTSESYEFIEPLRYKFTAMSSKKDFENMLYNSIDDNLNGRYKYRFVEKLSGIYLTVGNKLNYTDQTGKSIKKQSIADFNINYYAAIIKRETLIDGRSIPQLMGFMYNDMENIGTDMLPVPSIEVIFYFPENFNSTNEVEMFNGTPIDIAKGDGTTAFNEIDARAMQQSVSRPKDPNEKYVVVKYVNSDGEVLKENVIRDVMVGTTFVPDILPIINDRDGKEWICEPNQILSLNISNDNSKNELEVKYVKKISKIRINYINRQGGELRAPVVKNMQVGETFDINSVRKFIDDSKIEWNLYQSKPNKLIVSEEENQNVLTLIYDVIKADVFIYYKSRDGKELKEADKISAAANRNFSPEILNKVVDGSGLTWKYAADSKTSIYVSETETNSITLIYDELKKRVTTRFVNENGQKIKDDAVEIIQVGKTVDAKYEEEFTDIYNKKWKYKASSVNQLKVSEDEQQNIFEIKYDKVLSNVIISIVNEIGQKIKNDIIEKAQIGAVYTPNTIKEVEDNFGKVWTCIDENKSLTIDESEVKNRITFKYKPLMVNVHVQYVDDEGNQLLPQKEANVQVGSTFTPDFISSLQGQDQREWILSSNNIKEFKVNKHEEENLIKVNYDKKLVDINLIYKDINGNVLKSNATVKAQLGSEFKVGIYEKITSDNGERWMVTRTEPSRMFVKENSTFTLIYDEIKSKVIIKCVNISDSKSVVDDTAYITKLGGVYVPNVQQKIVDKLKRRWTYVGEPGMSIIAKENEQENIIVLKYEPDKANVTLKYINNNQQTVHKDVVRAEQIGSEVAIKEYDKVFEENGLGWKLKEMSRSTLIVDEDENKNIVTCNYEPLMIPVTTRYIDEKVNEITTSKVDNIQAGQKFNAVVLPRVTDDKDRVWVYSNINVEEITVKDGENNKVNIKYLPLNKNVTERFVDTEGNALINDKVVPTQVGEIYNLKTEERVIDSEGKSWIYKKSSSDKIKVLEEEGKNLITNVYDKELIKVVIKFQTSEGVTLDKDKNLDLQIGSTYDIEHKRTLPDSEKLLWLVSDKNQLKVKISREEAENVFTVVYDRYMVNVFDKFINEATNQEVIPAEVTKHQVGSSYLVTVQETIIDSEGKHWVQAAKTDSKIFASSYKVEPITVTEDEAKNFTIVKYKPKLIETTIRYQDPLGKQIKQDEVKKLQIGSTFSEEIPTKIVDSLGNKWSYNPNSNSNVKISEDPKENIIVLAYEEEKGTVTFIYLDKAGNELQKPTTKLVQIGTLYQPQFDIIVTDADGCVWEYQERDRENFEIKDEDKENIVKLTYIPMNVNVELTLVDLWGNNIAENKLVPAQLGSTYKPTITGNYTNDESKLYKLTKVEPESIKVKEIPIGKKNPNQIKLTFEPVNSNVIIMFQDLEGNSLRDEEKIQMQVGSKYKLDPIEFIKDRKGNQWQRIKSDIKEQITVLENEKENVVKYVYEVAKADIFIRFLSIDGTAVIPEQHEARQVGSEFVPKVEEHIVDNENKKWKLLKLLPVNLTVGSINNIVTATYQEEKVRVTWEYVTEDGLPLKSKESHEAQIGARYTPLVKDKVIYDANEIWRLLKIEPSEIIISENEADNAVKLIYTNSKVEAKVEEKKELVNPFANTLTEEEAKNIPPVKKNETNVENVGSETKNNVEDSAEKPFEFTDPYLQKLARSTGFTQSEKITINELNNLNAEIIDEYRASKAAYSKGQTSYDYTKMEELITKEKNMVKENLEKLITKDKSGAGMLKIFEHITASESDDKALSKVQRTKALQITDYFMDSQNDDDKVNYICERGKNNKEIELINKKISENQVKDLAEAVELKAILYYEKMILDNYYKVRSLSNDKYFEDPSVKSTSLPDIVVKVTNRLVEQAMKLFKKETLDLSQRNELEAILLLCTPQQISTIKAELDKLDGKLKRAGNKIIQEVTKIK